MIEFLREWTLSLAGIIVFGSLCEMLLPGSVYKKYVNLAVGLILCIAIISPFIKDKPQLSFEIPAADVLYEEGGNDDILAVYTEKLCKSIEDTVIEEAGVAVRAECQVSHNDEDMGRIECIYIYTDKDIGNDIITKISEMYGTESIIVKDNFYGN